MSLAAAPLLLAAVVVFLVHNGVDVAIGLVGTALAVASSWWAVTRRMPRRAVGIAGALCGLGLLAYAVLAAGNEDWASVVRLGVVLVLLAAVVVPARAALALSLRALPAAAEQRVAVPAHPVLLCNPWSGGGKVERFGVIDAARWLGVETVLLDRGLDLGALARGAIAAGGRLPRNGRWRRLAGPGGLDRRRR